MEAERCPETLGSSTYLLELDGSREEKLNILVRFLCNQREIRGRTPSDGIYILLSMENSTSLFGLEECKEM